MNGQIKFHKANGTAFNAGEQWVGSSGGGRCSIVSVRQFGNQKWDYEVTYAYEDGAISTKDAWNFQVRYTHIADLKIRPLKTKLNYS